MASHEPKKVAIVDYGLGNLFSVAQACAHVGMAPAITSSPGEILAADVVVLPGVGAFGDAMEHMERLDLVAPLRDVAISHTPLIAICLGMQLLMTESYEFGTHRGLGIIEGPVVRLDSPTDPPVYPPYTDHHRMKIPQVGWNGIFRSDSNHGPSVDEWHTDTWSDSPLAGLEDGEFMYFVHSYCAKPQDPGLVLSYSRYGNIEFCSSLRYGNVFGCQFHPERSGSPGLQIYRNVVEVSLGSVPSRSHPDG